MTPHVLVTGPQSTGGRWVRVLLKDGSIEAHHDGSHGTKRHAQRFDLVVAMCRNPYPATLSIQRAHRKGKSGRVNQAGMRVETWPEAVEMWCHYLKAVLLRYPDALWWQYEDLIREPQALADAIADRLHLERWAIIEVPRDANAKWRT